MASRIKIAKTLLLIVALQILNVSIYAQSCIMPSDNHAIGNINIIDSVAEYVSEIIFNHFNACPEFQKTGTHKDSSAHKNVSMNLVDDMKIFCADKETDSAKPFLNTYYKQYSFSFYKEINPPPPKVNIA